MSDFNLKKGLSLMDKVVMKLNELDKFTKIKKVSFLFFDCKEREDLKILLAHPLTKNIINVSHIKSDNEKVINMTRKEWDKNKEELYNKTSNSFVIEGNEGLALEETYSKLQSYSEYYPIVLFHTDESVKKTEINKAGFSSYVEKGFVCCVNKNLKDFKKYYFDDDKKSKNIFRETGEGIEVPIDIRKKSSPVSTEKDEDLIDFSFLKDLKSPSHEKKLNKYNIPSSKKWLQQFYEYLRDLLSRIFPPERKGLVDMILTNETLKTYWIPCFTHVSANPNPGKNYEAIETIGDAGLSYCFKFYVKEKEPYSVESRISNLNQRYMSKDFQSKVSKLMKLDEWLITQGIPADRIDNSEDLLESLFGTIDKLLFIKKGTTGLGVIVIYHFMKLLFDNIKFSDEASKNTEPERTYVEQYFSGQAFRTVERQQYTDLRKPKEIPEKLWEKMVKDMNMVLSKNEISPIVIKEDKESHRGIIENDKLLPDGKTIVTIKIMKSYADKVRGFGLPLEGKGDILIGKYVSNTKKTAEKMAYAAAKKWMIENGLTKEWKDSANKKKKSSILQKKDLVFEKAKSKFPDLVGEISVARLKTIKINGRDVVVYQIRGTDKEDRIVPIFTLTSQEKSYEQGVIDTYLIE